MKRILIVLISMFIVLSLTSCQSFQEDELSEESLSAMRDINAVNSNWAGVISENNLPTAIPAFKGDGEVRFNYDTITVHNNNVVTFQNYISNLENNPDWQLMKEITETHYVYYNEAESVILDISFELEALDDNPGVSEATVIEFATGQTAKFRASTYS